MSFDIEKRWAALVNKDSPADHSVITAYRHSPLTEDETALLGIFDAIWAHSRYTGPRPQWVSNRFTFYAYVAYKNLSVLTLRARTLPAGMVLAWRLDSDQTLTFFNCLLCTLDLPRGWPSERERLERLRALNGVDPDEKAMP